jgi:hypothetical protein
MTLLRTILDFPNFHETAVCHADVSLVARLAAAVDNRTFLNHEIVRHVLLLPSAERPEEPFNMTNPPVLLPRSTSSDDTSSAPKGRSPRNDTAIGPSCATDHPTARSSWSFMPFRGGIATRAGIKSGAADDVRRALVSNDHTRCADQAQFVVLGCRVSGSPPIRRFFIAMPSIAEALPIPHSRSPI